MVVATLAAAFVSVFVTWEEARATTVNEFTAFLLMGDSLSDPGNLFELTDGQQPPPDIYPTGRFTNGRVWAEFIADDFAADGYPTYNNAYGGAEANPATPSPISLGAQAFAPAFAPVSGLSNVPRELLGRRPLLTTWMGANDGFRAINEGLDVEATALAAARAVADTTATLAAQQGIGDLMFLNLPNLGLAPRYRLLEPRLAPVASSYSAIFNAALADHAADLRKAGFGVTEVDIATRFREVVDDPRSIGLINALFPCVIPNVTPVCPPQFAALSVFYDPVHPTEAVHAELADFVREQVPLLPAPLPAPLLLLGSGLLGLVLISRIRRA